MISSQGTDIGNAIELSMSSFNEERKTNKAITISVKLAPETPSFQTLLNK